MARKKVIDGMNATTGWTVLGNDTDNLATSTNRIRGTNALTFDKVDGAAGSTFAGIQKTLASLNLENDFGVIDKVTFGIYIPDLADVAKVVLRLGTSAGHCVEYQWADTNLVAAAWNFLTVSLKDFTVSATQGNGCQFSNIDYVVVAVDFDAEDDALAGIVVDQIEVVPVELFEAA